MTALLDERHIEGWYICLDVTFRVGGMETLYCSPTLFTEERKAEHWRDRYQKKFPGHKVYLKPIEVEMKR